MNVLNVLMISGDNQTIRNINGPFSQTLSHLGTEWSTIDVLCPGLKGLERQFNPQVKLYGVRKFLLFWDLIKFIKRKKYDLIITHDYGLMLNGLSAIFVLFFYKIPHISEIHHLEGYPTAVTWKESFYACWGKIYLSFFAKRFTAIRVVNRTSVFNLLKNLGVNENKILCIPSIYLDLEKYSPQRLTKEYDVLFVGRLVENKGIFTLLNSINDLKNKGLMLRTRIKGQGYLDEKIQRFIIEHHLGDLVSVDKKNLREDELILLYNQAKVLVCASTVEGGPRVTLEAMACGIPVITTACGLMPEVITHQQNGLLFDGTATDLSSKLEIIFGNDYYSKVIEQNARLAVVNYDYRKTLKSYATTYKNLILKP